MRQPDTWHLPGGLARESERLDFEWIEVGAGPDAAEYRFPKLGAREIELLLDQLRQKRAWLAQQPMDRVIDSIAGAAVRFTDPSSPDRELAVSLLSQAVDRDRAMVLESLDTLLAKLDRHGLRETLKVACGNPEALDRFAEFPDGRRKRALGPKLTFHVLAGNTPWAGMESLTAALLSRSASIVKLSRREPVLCGLFVKALAKVDPELADCCAVLYWPGGTGELEERLLATADAVVGFGDNANLAALSQKLAPRVAGGQVRWIPRGHRFSIAVLGPETLLDPESARKTARALARDIALEDQEGCLSPHAVFLVMSEGRSTKGESRGEDDFGRLLAEELARLEEEWPRGTIAMTDASHIHQERGSAELRGAKVICSPGSTRWTVVVEREFRFEPSPLHRFARIQPVAGVEDVVRQLEMASGLISTIAIEGFADKHLEAVDILSGLAAGRICAVGEMQRPPAGWNHDGQSDLASLLRWVDLEIQETGERS